MKRDAYGSALSIGIFGEGKIGDYASGLNALEPFYGSVVTDFSYLRTHLLGKGRG